MQATMTQVQRVRLEDTFYCRARRRRLSVYKCLDDFMNANAFDKRKSACWRCPQGRKTREAFSEE